MRMQLNYIQETLAFINKNGYEADQIKFLKSAAVFLAELFNVNYVLIDKYSANKPAIAETAVFYGNGIFLPNISYNLENTPCQNIINNKICSYPANIQAIFPKDNFLIKKNIDSYIGIPLWSGAKEPIGLIALTDNKPKSKKEVKDIEIILGIIGIKIEEILEKMLFENQLNLKIEELKTAKEKAEKSEEKLKTLSNLTFEGILIHDNLLALDFNASFLKMFGYERSELLGKKIKQILFPKKHHKKISEERTRINTLPYEIEGIKKDGTIFPIEIEARDFIDKTKKTVRVAAIRDITERKKAEIESKKLSVAIEQSANTIVITDIQGNIEYTNPKFTETTGYTTAEVLGKNPRILKSGEQDKEFYAHLWQTISGGNIWNGQMQNKAKSGKFYWEHVTITPIKDDSGRITSYLAIKEDISAQKTAEGKLLKANEEIEKSERKFRELYEKSSDAILIIKNGNFTDCNQATVNLLGYKTKEEFLNSHPSTLSPIFQPDGVASRKKAEEMMRISLKNGTHRFEWMHTKSNGELFPVEVLLTAISNEPNNQIIHCVWRDITHRKIAEEELQKQNDEYRILSDDYLAQNEALKQLSYELSEKNRLLLESKDRFINLFEQNPVPLWEQDFSKVIRLLNDKKANRKDFIIYLDKNPDFVEECISKIKILNVNKAALALFGVKNVEELKNHLGKTNTKKAIEVLKKELVSVGTNKKSFSHETELIGKDGSLIIAIIKSVIIDDYGTSIASVIDITTAKKIEQELLNSKEKVEESDRLKTEFIQNMSHEIRTPMNGILGFSELLDNPDLVDEKRKLFINIIKNSTHQLLHIIDDIMEISVLETKQIKAEENLVCLNDLLNELFTVFDIKATNKNIALVLKNGLTNQESTILTDNNKLNKVLSNLLENALKFTDEGIVELGYKLNKDSEPAELEIYVKDSGIGIKPEKQKLIFDRFSQAEKDLSKKVGGLGLGLSIAKENAELLGGKITVVSELGEGAAFFVTIPYKPINITAEITKEKEKISKKKDKYTILIAEDEEVNFMVLEILLVDKIKLPCTIIHAKNGLEAVEFSKTNPNIGLVLMDIKMPKMDGLEATKRIKEFRPNTPIIAQTAYSTPEEKEKAFLAGCDDFISKPINKDALNLVITKYLLVDKTTDPL